VNPDIREAFELRSWYDTKGKEAHYTSLSGQRGENRFVDVRKQFSVLSDEKLKQPSDQATYFLARGTVTFFRHDFAKPPWYQACPKPDCNKKVIPEGHDAFRCEKCRITYKQFTPRLILSLLACDHSGGTWLTAFNEHAEILLEKTAQELSDLVAQGNESAFEQVFADANFKTYIFKIRAKSEPVMDEYRVRCHILGLTKLDFRTESNHLLDEISRLEQL